ncbi:hypothetical protein BUALT_Bualt04G0054600 [Buddleja alternifolia]|uniref:Uncharacterized protein n=1 Tax=Buddleja alternifolia TaxID=168488 RepID=A0AAV6XX58_9LAMI|nr:hypothetical protein BUALT_Bualt04G0054600 [Buddleja alternifolia]
MEASRAGLRANGKKRRTCHKWHWTREEDELLTTLVNKHGLGSWDYIANHIQGRTGKSCRLRWINQLDPKIDKSPFSGEEHRRLIELHHQYGNRWSTIMRFFPGRTDNQVKNQYHVLVGSRHMKTTGPCSSTDACGPVKRQSTGLSQYGSVSTVPVGSQFSSANCCGSSSSVYGRNDVSAHQITSHGDSLMSDASSAACSELCSLVAQPQQGEGNKDYPFIDFLGVGNSE